MASDPCLYEGWITVPVFLFSVITISGKLYAKTKFDLVNFYLDFDY